MLPGTQSSAPLITQSLKFWFGCLVLIGPIHILEQIWFGLDELDEVKRIAGGYYGWFENDDLATVLFVIFVVVLVQLLVYGALSGGRWRLTVAGFWGLTSVAEIHHFVKTLLHGAYFPGMVTSFGYVAIGVMILATVVREWRAIAHPARTQFATA
jgi:hypothetical protein